MTEAELQQTIIDAAHYGGWTVAHFRPARTVDEWRTPVAADGAGFPDLILVRGDRCLAWELKSARGRVSEEQATWLAILGAVPGISADVIRPDDLDWACAVLLG